MAPQAPSALHNATKTINGFFQHHKRPPDIRNAWAFLKTQLHPSNTPPPQPPSLAPISEALKKIQDCLTLIEKRVFAPQSAAKPFFSYADVAKMPPQPPPPTSEKFVPSRLLKEVIVKTISDAAPQQPPAQVIEAINKTRAGKQAIVIAARRLESGDVLVTADSRPTKALLEQEREWTKVIAGKMHVESHRFMMLAHSVKVSRVDP